MARSHSPRPLFKRRYRSRRILRALGAGFGPPTLQVADPRDWPLLQRFVRRQRQLVEPDLLVLASDHWNFNVRGFNPGGNHGSFFRISTHSVLMFSGTRVPPSLSIDRPYDSLSFVPTLLSLLGRPLENTWPGPVISELLSPDRTAPAQALPRPVQKPDPPNRPD